MIIQGGVSLSKKDLKVLQVVEDYRAGKLNLELSSSKLGVSIRTMLRKAKAHREHGLKGLLHGNKGRKPKNVVSEEIKTWYIEIYREKYFDFNFLHAYEYINDNESPPGKVSYNSFRLWMRSAGLGKKKKRRASKARLAREREACEGLMLQLDGSPDRYNGKDKWTLINLIDDATSKLSDTKFYPSETTLACFESLRRVVETDGIPEFILTDCAGWAQRVGKRSHFSQFKRLCEQLGITLISTSTPETKGRVERSFRTAQDRLIPELRLHGIKTMTDANRYLEQVFKPQWNDKFAVSSKSGTKRFKPVASHIVLDDVFSLQFKRVVNRNHTVSYENRSYLLTSPPQNLHKKVVTVLEDRTGNIKIQYQGEELESKKLPQYKRGYKKAG